MTGFPGETDKLFAESYSFIERLPFTYLHVFTYSSRPGTPSVEMEDQIPVAVARARNRLLRELAARKNLEFRKSFLGQTLDVITLQSVDDCSTEALSDNYLKVRLQGQHPANRWIKAEVTEVGVDDVVAVAQREEATTKNPKPTTETRRHGENQHSLL